MSASALRILKQASTLPVPELDQLMVYLASLRAEKVAPPLPEREAELLQQIHTSVPLALREHWRLLHEVQGTRPLTEAESVDLSTLVDDIEEKEAYRASLLSELARMRGVSLLALTEQLRLRPRDTENA